MSIMMDCINVIKQIFLDNLAINHTFIGDYSTDFVPEDYPAICLEPDAGSVTLGETLGFDYDNNVRVNVYLIEKAPENRDKKVHIQNVDLIIGALQQNPRLNGLLNQGINITASFGSRQTTDNIEFVTKIAIEGRNV